MKRPLIYFAACMMMTTANINAQTKPVYLDESQPLEARVQDALSRMTLEEKCRLSYAQSKFSSPGVPRLGIPELYMSDGPHGVRMEINWNDWAHANWTNDYCTAFPALTCLAATWNTDLATLYGKSAGEEARYRKKDILLGPGVNLFRTPLNGRNFEYMGEDPILAGLMAGNYIQGLQSNGVASCLKHYALNEQEEMRGHVDTKVSDRALHEIYLRPFQIAIEKGNPWSVMGSYNRYRGHHNTHNRYLINEILKGEWGYPGAVISDWGATHSTSQASLYGLDIEMGSYTNGLTSEGNGFGYDDYYLGSAYLEMARNGEIPMEVVDDKAARVLRLIFQSAMNGDKPWGSINSPEHIAANRQIAEEGVVLLKNDAQLLPIDPKKYKTVLVVGDNATKPLCPGGGSSELKPKDEVSPLRGIQERFGNDWNIIYAQGYESGSSRYDGADYIPEDLQQRLFDEAVEKARQADLIIYVGGLNKNHFEDCEGGDRLNYNLSYGQDKLISTLLDIQPNMVTVIVSGTAYAMPWIDNASTLVQSWYLGSEAGHALASILAGDVNPSGKTVFTYAKALEDYPAHQYGLIGYPGVDPSLIPDAFACGLEKTLDGTVNDETNNGNPSSAYLLKNAKKIKKGVPDNLSTQNLNVDFDATKHYGSGNEAQVYAEDIWLGYRYFDTQSVPVVFPFGYGLSYTTFEYSNPTISAKKIADGQPLTVTIDVTNAGNVAGKEIVQLYVGDDKASVVRPTKELKGFEKITLNPGETKTVTFTITTDDLKFYDENAHEWKAEPGTFKAYIGASSADIKSKLPFEL